MSEQEKRRGPGAPLQSEEGSEHIDLTLPREIIRFLRSMPKGQRSKFVKEAIEQKRKEKPYGQ